MDVGKEQRMTLIWTSKGQLHVLAFFLLLGFVLSLPPTSSRSYYSGKKFACQRDSDCDFPTMYCNNVTDPQEPFCDCGIFHTWSTEFHSCVGLVKTSCARGRRCAIHSICSPDEWCECDKYHSATKSRRCLLAINSTCDPSPDASDSCNHEQHLYCDYERKTCDCKFQGQMKYDEKKKECRMLVGEPCDALEASYYREQGRPQHSCMEGASCVTREKNDSVGECRCNNNFVFDNVTKICVIPTALIVPKNESPPPVTVILSPYPDLTTETDTIPAPAPTQDKSVPSTDTRVIDPSKEGPTSSKNIHDRHPTIIVFQHTSRSEDALLRTASSSSSIPLPFFRVLYNALLVLVVFKLVVAISVSVVHIFLV